MHKYLYLHLLRDSIFLLTENKPVFEKTSNEKLLQIKPWGQNKDEINTQHTNLKMNKRAATTHVSGIDKEKRKDQASPENSRSTSNSQLDGITEKCHINLSVVNKKQPEQQNQGRPQSRKNSESRSYSDVAS
jgi:hypothetical protein